MSKDSKCVICRTPFPARGWGLGVVITCSDECKREYNNKRTERVYEREERRACSKGCYMRCLRDGLLTSAWGHIWRPHAAKSVVCRIVEINAQRREKE